MIYAAITDHNQKPCRDWFSRYQAVCLPLMRAALLHMLVTFSNPPEDCSVISLIPDGNKIVSEFEIRFANKQVWNMNVLHRHLSEMELSTPGLRAAESFCRAWYRPYLSDLKNHLIRITQGNCTYQWTVDLQQMNVSCASLSANTCHLGSEPCSTSEYSPSEEFNHTPTSTSLTESSRYVPGTAELKSNANGLSKIHSPSISQSPSSHSLFCPLHKKQFKTLTNYNRHLRDKHSGGASKKWKCSKCHKSFTRKAYRDKHEAEVKWHRLGSKPVLPTKFGL